MAREQRLVFGEDAEQYDRARPSYPAELVDDLVAWAGVPSRTWPAPEATNRAGPAPEATNRAGPAPEATSRAGPAPEATSRAVDIGCGTGKATVLLAERGLSGVGIEPDPAMAAIAVRNLQPFPSWHITVQDFEQFDVESNRGRFDLVTSAQAWHWLDPDLRIRNVHALLRPGGRLALWWNRPAADDSDLRRQIDAVYSEHFPTLSPHNVLAAGRPPVGPLPPGFAFGPAIERAYPWVQRYSTQEWIDQIQTHSDHRLAPPDRLRPLLDAVAEVIDRHGGFYDYPYSCWLWTAVKD